MSRSGTWKPIAAAGLAAASLAGAVAAILGLRGVGTPIHFAAEHDRRAYDLLLRPSSAGALQAAAAEAQQAVRLSPYSNTARLRLTYIDTLQRGRVGGTGLAQFSKSYDLVPLDHTVAAWRVRFGLEHWTEISPELRQAVEAEAKAFGRTGSQDADVQGAMDSVQSPEGRLAVALWRRALAK